LSGLPTRPPFPDRGGSGLHCPATVWVAERQHGEPRPYHRPSNSGCRSRRMPPGKPGLQFASDRNLSVASPARSHQTPRENWRAQPGKGFNPPRSESRRGPLPQLTIRPRGTFELWSSCSPHLFRRTLAPDRRIAAVTVPVVRREPPDPADWAARRGATARHEATARVAFLPPHTGLIVRRLCAPR